MSRIVIKGLGAVGPWGHNHAAFERWWQEGRPSLRRPLTGLSEPWLPVAEAAEVPAWKAAQHLPDRKAIKIMSRPVQFGVAAAMEAYGEGHPAPAERRAIFVGAGQNFDEDWTFREPIAASTTEDKDPRFDMARFATEGQAALNPLWLVKGLSNNVLAMAALYLDLQGPNNNFGMGAAGGLIAIAEAARALVAGEAEVALAGAADSLVTVEDLVQGARAERGAGSRAGPLPSQAGVFARLERSDERGWGLLGAGSATAACLGEPDPESLDAAALRASSVAWALCRDGRPGPCRPESPWSAGAPACLLRTHGFGSAPLEPIQAAALALGDSGAASGLCLLLFAEALARIDGVAGPIEVQARGHGGEVAVLIFGHR